MGCCSNKQVKVVQENQPISLRPAPIATTQGSQKPDFQSDAPVAKLLRHSTSDLKDRSLSEAVLLPEAPAKPSFRPPSPLPRPSEALTNVQFLPEIKSVSRTNGFDKERFKQANKDTLPPLSNLPLSVQEQLAEVDELGRVAEKGNKPSSSLALLSQKPREKQETNMEQYLDARYIVYP